MEIVELDPTVSVRGAAVLAVRHRDTHCRRGLEQREPVVLRTATGDLYAASVRSIEFEPADTVYTFEVGARLPDDLAVERVEGLDPTRHDLEMHELVDLLGRLRVERSSDN